MKENDADAWVRLYPAAVERPLERQIQDGEKPVGTPVGVGERIHRLNDVSVLDLVE